MLGAQRPNFYDNGTLQDSVDFTTTAISSLEMWIHNPLPETNSKFAPLNGPSQKETTVDGWNPAPVDMVHIPLFTGFYTSQVVVWDFFHQQ